MYIKNAQIYLFTHDHTTPYYLKLLIQNSNFSNFMEMCIRDRYIVANTTGLQKALWEFYEVVPGEWMTDQIKSNLKLVNGNLVPTDGDVYKRQHVHDMDYERLWSTFNKTDKKVLIGLTTVSYTHLDVYKRQFQCSTTGEICYRTSYSP